MSKKFVTKIIAGAAFGGASLLVAAPGMALADDHHDRDHKKAESGWVYSYPDHAKPGKTVHIVEVCKEPVKKPVVWSELTGKVKLSPGTDPRKISKKKDGKLLELEPAEDGEDANNLVEPKDGDAMDDNGANGGGGGGFDTDDADADHKAKDDKHDDKDGKRHHDSDGEDSKDHKNDKGNKDDKGKDDKGDKRHQDLEGEDGKDHKNDKGDKDSKRHHDSDGEDSKDHKNDKGKDDKGDKRHQDLEGEDGKDHKNDKDGKGRHHDKHKHPWAYSAEVTIPLDAEPGKYELKGDCGEGKLTVLPNGWVDGGDGGVAGTASAGMIAGGAGLLAAAGVAGTALLRRRTADGSLA